MSNYKQAKTKIVFTVHEEDYTGEWIQKCRQFDDENAEQTAEAYYAFLMSELKAQNDLHIKEGRLSMVRRFYIQRTETITSRKANV